MKIFRLVRIWQSAHTLDPAIDDAIIEAIKAGKSLSDIYDEFDDHLSAMEYEPELEEELDKDRNFGWPTWELQDDEYMDIPIEGISDATAMLYAVWYSWGNRATGDYNEAYRLYIQEPTGLKKLDDVKLGTARSIEASIQQYWDNKVSEELNDFDNYKLQVL